MSAAELLDLNCEVCGDQATWGDSSDKNQMYILGPKHEYVESGLTKIGHHCRACRNEIAKKFREVTK